MKKNLRQIFRIKILIWKTSISKKKKITILSSKSSVYLFLAYSRGDMSTVLLYSNQSLKCPCLIAWKRVVEKRCLVVVNNWLVCASSCGVLIDQRLSEDNITASATLHHSHQTVVGNTDVKAQKASERGLGAALKTDYHGCGTRKHWWRSGWKWYWSCGKSITRSIIS